MRYIKILYLLVYLGKLLCETINLFQHVNDRQSRGIWSNDDTPLFSIPNNSLNNAIGTVTLAPFFSELNEYFCT